MLRSLLLVLVACGARPNAALHGEWSAPVAPFQITDHVYYVGAQHISSFVITTSKGNVLIDSGTREMERVIANGLAQLHLAPPKTLLCTHAHYDHVGSHAALERRFDAQVMVMRADAEAVRTGVDLSPLHDEGWEPVRVDRILDDGDHLDMGDVSLDAIAAPGHTPGCTVWMIHAVKTIAIYGCARPNDSVRLTPALIADTRATFAKLRKLSPDIALITHPDDPAAELLHPTAWTTLLDEAERDFATQLAKQ
ncbi:MAG: MBL fold metallo-hydrolase [Kofleriaceae bacterium]